MCKFMKALTFIEKINNSLFYIDKLKKKFSMQCLLQK